MEPIKQSQAEREVSRPHVFPRPGTTLHNVVTDPDYRQAFRARIKQGNRFIVPLYKLGILPLFGFSKQVMLLTTRGRKSHEMRATPIGYFRIDHTITLFSGWGRKADWYKNILACPDEVFIQIGFHRQHVIPEIIVDPGEIRQIIERLIRQDPMGARTLMGWDPAQDDLETANFSTMIEKVLIVRFHTDSSG